MTAASRPGCYIVLVPQVERLLTAALVDRLGRAVYPGGGRTTLTICYSDYGDVAALIAQRKRALGIDPTPGVGRRDELRRYPHVLADELNLGDAEIIEACVAFMERDQVGLGYGRARARMCRRFKHCALTAQQSKRLVDTVARGLRSGRFDQQFPEHLKLAYRLDPAGLTAVARECAQSPLAYVRRRAAWVLGQP